MDKELELQAEILALRMVEDKAASDETRLLAFILLKLIQD